MKSPLALLLLLCGLALAGCGPQTTPRPPCPKGELCLEWGNNGEPDSLDPQIAGAEWETVILNDLFVNLTDTDQAGRTIPGMATHWEVSDDALTWTFHLRDAKWSDGVPVTAGDFVFGLQRLMDPKTAAEQASQVYAIKNAKLVNGGKLPVSALGVRAI
ncbi:MAG: ABC transporter substrate-binding protein, partial [Caulobacteraceae bacterium]